MYCNQFYQFFKSSAPGTFLICIRVHYSLKNTSKERVFFFSWMFPDVSFLREHEKYRYCDMYLHFVFIVTKYVSFFKKEKNE